MFATGASETAGVTITLAGVIVACSAILVLGGAAGLLWKFFGSPIFNLMGRTNHFLDDWFGVPARDGVPARPGVMVRLASVEADKVDKVEFIALAGEVARRATRDELIELRLSLQRHIASSNSEEPMTLHVVEEEDPQA